MRYLNPFLALSLLVVSLSTRAQLTLISSFDPADASGLCGVAYDPDSALLWVYDCSAATIQQYTPAGASVRSVPRPGESSNDADLSMAPGNVLLGGSTIQQGRLLFFNGETGTADIYGIEQGPGTVTGTLVTAFGLNHVVGGAYHPLRNTYFLVQDDDANATDENRVAEIDPVTGEVLGTFQFTGTYAVNYGDLEISAETGNLFLVSNSRPDIAEFTPEGVLVQLHALPDGVTALSGLSFDCGTGTAWACSSSGVIYNLGGFPCDVGTGVAGPAGFGATLHSWPNPAADQIWIKVDGAVTGTAQLVVRDRLGRTIADMPPLITLGPGHYTVDIDVLARGMYVLDLYVGGRHWTHRMVKE